MDATCIVTTPHAIREQLGLLPDTEVTIDIIDGEARLRKGKKSAKVLPRGARIVRQLRAVRPTVKLSTDEIMSLMRGER